MRTMRLDELSQEEARALCDAGYMPLRVYIELCERKGWPKDR